MAYIGRTKTPAPLTSADIPDGIVTAADLAPDSVGTSEIADSVTLVTPNLGTVASGNLSNTAIVYPAGHILQHLTKSKYFTSSVLDGGSNWNEVDSNLRITFNRRHASSKICGWVYSGKPRAEYNTGTKLHVSIGKGTSFGTTATTNLWIDDATFSGEYHPYNTTAKHPTTWHMSSISSPASETIYTAVYSGTSSGSPYHRFIDGAGWGIITLIEYMP